MICEKMGLSSSVNIKVQHSMRHPSTRIDLAAIELAQECRCGKGNGGTMTRAIANCVPLHNRVVVCVGGNAAFNKKAFRGATLCKASPCY
jgi:hypothetical protein